MRRFTLPVFALLIAGLGCSTSKQTEVSSRSQGNLPPILSLTPPLPMYDGQTQRIASRIISSDGRTDRVIVWSADIGTIGQDGVYIAPVALPQGASATTAKISAYIQDYPAVKSDTTVLVRRVDISGLAPINSAPNGITLLRPTVAAPEGVSTNVVYSTIGGGSVDINGFYTAPSQDGLSLVRAISVADPRKYSESLVNVGGEGVRVGVFPSQAAMAFGDSLQLTSTVTGTSDTGVTWTTSNGSITQSGLFTPNAPGSVTVNVVSKKDPSAVVLSNITVSSPSIHIYPDQLNMMTGESRAFTAIVQGSLNQAVTWYVGQGTITQNGVYTATSAQSNSVTIKAVLNADVSVVGTATVGVSNLDSGVEIFVIPSDIRLLLGTKQTFTALVYGTSDTSVYWNTNGGNIDSLGSYTATEVGTWVVKATSHANPSKVAAANVTVVSELGGIKVTINPSTAEISTFGTIAFSAVVTGDTNTGVHWAATGGTINSSGFYTAPGTAGIYTVIAISDADSTKSAQATVTVH